MKQPVVLRIYKGDKLEAVRQFENSQIVIGRGGDVQLELQDEGVALLHAMIEDRDGEYYISDLGSATGTFVNNERTLESKLNSGDSLTLGAFRIQFFVGVPKPAAPPKAVTPAAPIEAPNTLTYSSSARQAPRERAEVPPTMPAEMPKEETPVASPIEKKAATSSEARPATETVTTPATGASVGAAAAAGVSIPQAKKTGSPFVTPLKASKKTFAPQSPYTDLKQVLKPGKGSVVEVIVAWKERILSTNHFREGNVSISSAGDADVIVPIISSTSKYELLKIGPVVTVCLTQEMVGELIREGGESLSLADLSRQNKLRNVGTHYELDLRQGEMLRIGLQDNLISLYIRYKPDSPKPLVAPLMDMTSSEVTGIILALLVAGIGWFYMNIFTPSPLLEDEARVEEPIRKAIVKFNPPPKVEQPIEEPKKPEPKKEPPKVVKAVEKPTKAPDPTPKRQTPTPSPEKAGDPGKGGNGNGNGQPAKSEKKNKNAAKMKQGGAVKTSPKEGAQMHSEKPDPTKQGLLGAFSSKGMQKQLDKAYAGSGELAGAANSATGYAGNAENRAGDNLGGRMKDTGEGGKGSGTIGIGGIGTSGRGTGTTGYGSGGIGTKGSVQINVGGQEGEFEGGMDKEAIRRVIREHIREIRNCYERELQTHPDLYGKLVIQWDIGEGGKVMTASTKSNSLASQTVAECITSRLKTWKFPDPPAGMVGRVSYPFLFSSQ